MKSKGFTLIELLIVIAIILILIAIALPNFLEAQIRARVAKARGEMRTIATSMESYIQDFKFYPTDSDNTDIFGGGTQRGLLQLTSPINYLGTLPVDPFNQEKSTGGDEIGYYEMGSTDRPPRFLAVPQWSGAFGIRNQIHAYVLLSAGPNHGEEYHSNDSWPWGGMGSTCTSDRMGGVNYSPTNGTKSAGDLILYGGSYLSGKYCVDDWHEVIGAGAFPHP